jgi:hypothetical protein
MILIVIFVDIGGLFVGWFRLFVGHTYQLAARCNPFGQYLTLLHSFSPPSAALIDKLNLL